MCPISFPISPTPNKFFEVFGDQDQGDQEGKDIHPGNMLILAEVTPIIGHFNLHVKPQAEVLLLLVILIAAIVDIEIPEVLSDILVQIELHVVPVAILQIVKVSEVPKQLLSLLAVRDFEELVVLFVQQGTHFEGKQFAVDGGLACHSELRTEVLDFEVEVALADPEVHFRQVQELVASEHPAHREVILDVLGGRNNQQDNDLDYSNHKAILNYFSECYSVCDATNAGYYFVYRSHYKKGFDKVIPMDLKQTIDLTLATAHSRNVSQDCSYAVRRTSQESEREASFRVKKTKRSCGTSFNMNSPTPEYSMTDPGYPSSQCNQTLLIAPASCISHHNGLLTPFSRRQISFMRNIKHRPGPLQEISGDSLLGIGVGFGSKPIDGDMAFRATFHSAFLPPKTKRMKSRKERQEAHTRETFILKSKAYGISSRQHRPKFFEDNSTNTTRNNQFKHKQDDKMLELQKKYKHQSKRSKEKDIFKAKMMKKQSDRFEGLAPWASEDIVF